MKSEYTLPGVAGFDIEHPVGVPEIDDTYRDALSNLVLLQEDGVTHFYGCYLDLDEDKKVWMSPVEVDDGESYSYFQVLYVNTTPQEAFGEKNLPVSLLEIDEASFKLTPVAHPGYRQLTAQFNSERKHVLIRHCNTGMAYYPRSITPEQESRANQSHAEKLIAVTGLREPEVSVSFSKPSEKQSPMITTRVLDAIHARRYNFAGHEVYSYGVVLEDDPWQYYEVFTPRRIERIASKELLVRVDSGCDIGQIYNDHGCDCREQLHAALAEMQEMGQGAVIHIPAQDGRGYGAATKMETEGLKRGLEVATSRGDCEDVDTISAAQALLGDRFDIRTYNGAGKLLGMLGVESIILQTDNRLKAEGLEAGGISVQRTPTHSYGANGSERHVKSKHQHTDIYYGTGEEGH